MERRKEKVKDKKNEMLDNSEIIIQNVEEKHDMTLKELGYLESCVYICVLIHGSLFIRHKLNFVVLDEHSHMLRGLLILVMM